MNSVRDACRGCKAGKPIFLLFRLVESTLEAARWAEPSQSCKRHGLRLTLLADAQRVARAHIYGCGLSAGGPPSGPEPPLSFPGRPGPCMGGGRSAFSLSHCSWLNWRRIPRSMRALAFSSSARACGCSCGGLGLQLLARLSRHFSSTSRTPDSSTTS